MTEINRETVSAALDKVVAEKGENFIYRRQGGHGACTYVHNYGTLPEPGCVWGHVLHELGVPLATLHNYDRVPELNQYSVDVQTVLEKLGVEDYVLKEAAGCAQSLQDNGDTWGVAREAFYRSLGR